MRSWWEKIAQARARLSLPWSDQAWLALAESNGGIRFASLLERRAVAGMRFAPGSEAAGALLRRACHAGWTRAAELLLDLGADPNRIHRDAMRTLPDADAGAFPEASFPPLALACAAGHGACVELLLRRGADASLEGRTGTPLSLALRLRDLSCAKLLLAAGAQPRPSARDCLAGRAAHEGNAPALRLLLDLELSPEGANPLGSPLISASFMGRLECVATLIEAGADLNAVECSSGSSALAMAARHGEAGAIALLARSGAPIDSADRHGMTPLGEAVRRSRPECLDLLLALGANPNVVVNDSQGLTPLMLAAMNGCEQCARSLLRGGADILHADPKGAKLLRLAREHSKRPGFDSLAVELARMAACAGERRELASQAGSMPQPLALPPRL